MWEVINQTITRTKKIQDFREHFAWFLHDKQRFFLNFLFVCLHMLKDFVFSFSHDKLFLLGNTFLSWNVFSFSHSTFMYPPYIFSLFSHMIKTFFSLISFFSTWFLHDFFLKMFFSVNSIMIQNIFSWFFFHIQFLTW